MQICTASRMPTHLAARHRLADRRSSDNELKLRVREVSWEPRADYRKRMLVTYEAEEEKEERPSQTNRLRHHRNTDHEHHCRKNQS